MRFKQLGFTLTEMLVCGYILLIGVGLWGWVWNIVKIVGSDFTNLTGMLVMRCAGVIVPPLGAVLGFL